MSAIKEHLAHYLERRAAGDPPSLALYRARCEDAARQNLHEVYSYGSGQYLLDGIGGVPDGYRLTLTVHDDTDSRPDDCFDPAVIEAWQEDHWRYVGIEVAVVDDDGVELASDMAIQSATARLERRAAKAAAEQAERRAAVEAEIVRRARIDTLLATIPPHVATELRTLIGA